MSFLPLSCTLTGRQCACWAGRVGRGTYPWLLHEVPYISMRARESLHWVLWDFLGGHETSRAIPCGKGSHRRRVRVFGELWRAMGSLGDQYM